MYTSTERVIFPNLVLSRRFLKPPPPPRLIYLVKTKNIVYLHPVKFLAPSFCLSRIDVISARVCIDRRLEFRSSLYDTQGTQAKTPSRTVIRAQFFIYYTFPHIKLRTSSLSIYLPCFICIAGVMSCFSFFCFLLNSLFPTRFVFYTREIRNGTGMYVE